MESPRITCQLTATGLDAQEHGRAAQHPDPDLGPWPTTVQCSHLRRWPLWLNGAQQRKANVRTQARSVPAAGRIVSSMCGPARQLALRSSAEELPRGGQAPGDTTSKRARTFDDVRLVGSETLQAGSSSSRWHGTQRAACHLLLTLCDTLGRAAQYIRRCNRCRGDDQGFKPLFWPQDTHYACMSALPSSIMRVWRRLIAHSRSEVVFPLPAL